jgi:hypothetical protein
MVGAHTKTNKTSSPSGWGVSEAILYGVWLSCVLNLYCANINEKSMDTSSFNLLLISNVCE